LGEDIAAKVNSPEFRVQLENIRTLALKSGDIAKLSALGKIHSDSLLKNRAYMLSPDGIIFNYNDNSNRKIRQSEEYKKLKEKFDNDVKELKEKMDKKEKNEKAEGGNKSSQISPAVILYNNKDFSAPVQTLKIENAMVTYKKADFKIADQLALKSFVKTDSPVAFANQNTINISVK